jgi:hypothetical protein
VVTTDWWVAGPAIAVAAGTMASSTFALIQISQDRKRRRADARREQAERISAWPGAEGERQEVVLLNRSNAPVYQAVASFVFVQGAGWRTGEGLRDSGLDIATLVAFQKTINAIAPGRSRVWVPGDWHGMHKRPGIEIAFTDRAGVHWVRRATGELEELPEPPFDHYRVFLPADLVTPEPLPD